jgi:shikimate kinase
MSQFKRIFIIGQPGAGKGLVAKTLAERLGWKFVNADLGLEIRLGRTLKEILDTQGEQSFQVCQSDILTFLLQQENVVITTDASIVDHEKNKKLLSLEFIVYLTVSTSVQLKRITTNSIPLFQTNNLEDFLNKLHNERDYLYEKFANLKVSSDDNALEKHVAHILDVLADKNTYPLKNRAIEELIIFHKTQHIPINLTTQQTFCLKLLADGKTSKEIAREMNISYRTVEGHIAKMSELLGCSSSKELVALYYDKP